MRWRLALGSCLLVLAAAACGGKTAGVDTRGPGSSSSGSSSGSGGSSSGAPSSSSGASSSGGSSAPPPGCTVDSSVACGEGLRGYNCSGGVSPVTKDPGLACSTPVPAGDRDTYCCSLAADTGCSEDPHWTTMCPGPMAVGYLCTVGVDPASLEPTLTCGAPKHDSAETLDYYCCTY